MFILIVTVSLYCGQINDDHDDDDDDDSISSPLHSLLGRFPLTFYNVI